MITKQAGSYQQEVAPDGNNLARCCLKPALRHDRFIVENVSVEPGGAAPSAPWLKNVLKIRPAQTSDV
jgi:hypothetical protein